MSNTKTVQRSPDLGIGIRMKRLPGGVPVIEPKAPVWWGWLDDDGKKATQLTTLWAATDPLYSFGYWPGLWAAVVEDAATAQWQIEFTPKIWYEESGTTSPVWTGDVIAWSLPPSLPDTAENLFTPKTVHLPAVDFGNGPIEAYQYWPAGAYISTFESVPIPSVIASGNTCSVGQDSKSMSGTLVAKATVGRKPLGQVSLELMRVIHRVWS
jgi:hypothetical protein